MDLRIDIENRLRGLQAALAEATEAFETEPGVARTHRGDDGPSPMEKG
jgi:hypothetical protein